MKNGASIHQLTARDRRIAELEGIRTIARTPMQQLELDRLLNARDLHWRRLPAMIAGWRDRLDTLERYARSIRFPLDQRSPAMPAASNVPQLLHDVTQILERTRAALAEQAAPAAAAPVDSAPADDVVARRRIGRAPLMVDLNRPEGWAQLDDVDTIRTLLVDGPVFVADEAGNAAAAVLDDDQWRFAVDDLGATAPLGFTPTRYHSRFMPRPGLILVATA